MQQYINLALIIIIVILFIAFLITRGTGAQKEKLYSPGVPINLGNGRVAFVTSN